jgi:hypothetical protein
MKQKRFRRLFMGASGLMLMASVQAGIPVWTYSAPNPAQVTVSAGSSATVQYTVTNQSTRTKNLILKVTPGLSASPCYLAGKGSSCALTLTVNGSQIPEQGLHAGPIMCEQGNPNQCYQPGAGNVLNVVKGNSPPVTDAVISLNPSSVIFTAGNTSSLITLTNTSSIVANGLNITPSANLSLVSNTCGATLAPQASCQFSVTSAVVSTGNSVSIHGSNTNSAVLDVTVSAVPLAMISVSPTTLVLAQNGPAETVTLSNTSLTTAVENLQATIPGASAITISSTTCTSTLAANSSCQYSFLPGSGAETNTVISINGSNTTGAATVTANVSAAVISATPDAFSFAEGGATQVVTITNDGSVDAFNVGATMNTPTRGVTLTGNTCPSSLSSVVPNNTCQLTFTSGSSTGATTATIAGTNTNSITADITVTAASNTTLSVTAITSPAVIAVNPASGVQLSIENTGSTTAYSVVYTLPSGWNGVNSGSCGDIPPAPGPGNTCTLTFNATQPNVTNTIGFSADNAAVVQSPSIAFSYQGYLVYAVTPTTSTTGTVYVVNTADSGVYQWDSTSPDCNDGLSGTSTCAVTNATSLTDGQYADSLGNTYKIITTIGTQNPPYSTNAAGACYNITTSSGNAVPQGTWYLPAKDELNNICVSLRSLGFGGFSTGYYWSSAEYSDSTDSHCPSVGACAWFQWLGFGDCSPQVAQPKSYPGSRVRCSQAIVY